MMQLLTTDCFRVTRPQSALTMAEADSPPSPGAEVWIVIISPNIYVHYASFYAACEKIVKILHNFK